MKKSPNQTIYAIWIDRKHAMLMKATTQEEADFIEIKSGVGRERVNGETTNKTGMLGTTLDWQKKNAGKGKQPHPAIPEKSD